MSLVILDVLTVLLCFGNVSGLVFLSLALLSSTFCTSGHFLYSYVFRSRLLLLSVLFALAALTLLMLLVFSLVCYFCRILSC